ncbi:hypothetical protein OPS90_26160, partial [Escherichia coli]
WEGWAIHLRQKQKKLIMLPSETMIWQPEFTDKTLSRKIGAVQTVFRLTVVRTFLPRRTPASLITAMRRATVHLATLIPSRNN